MINSLPRRGLVMPGLWVTLIAACVSFTGTVSANASATSKQTTTARGPQGGYVVTPLHLRSARVQFRVPAVHCSGTVTRSVRVGIFGYTRNGSNPPRPWFAAATSSCRNGRPHYVANFGPGNGGSALHAGDLLRIIVHRGSSPSYEIDNLTNGSGFGGGSMSSAPPVTLSSVVLGAERAGSPAHTDVALMRCAVNGTPIGARRHHRQQQVLNHKVVVDPSALSHGTAFDLTVR